MVSGNSGSIGESILGADGLCRQAEDAPDTVSVEGVGGGIVLEVFPHLFGFFRVPVSGGP